MSEDLGLNVPTKDTFNRSFDNKQKIKLKSNRTKMRNMLGAELNIDTDMGGTGTYDKEMSEMGKTSNFGGHLQSAGLSVSHTGQRLSYQNTDLKQPQQYSAANNVDDDPVNSCQSVKGSTICPSPSPTRKTDERFSNM